MGVNSGVNPHFLEKGMRMFKRIAILAVLLIALPLVQSQQQSANISLPEVAGLPATARAAAESIDPAKIRAHVRFLSGFA